MHPLERFLTRESLGRKIQETKFARAGFFNDLGLLTRHKLKNQNVELVQQLDPNLPALMADATQLEQAFLNITLNAVQAMPQGGRLRITTRVSPASKKGESGRLIVEFSDSGEGLTEAQCRKAFQPLFTTRTSGTGLGLAIVSRVVETHRGEVQIRSRPGEGTTVTIALPVDLKLSP